MNVELDKDEQIIQRFHRHWADLSPSVLMAAGLVAAAVGLWSGAGLYRRIAPMLPTGIVHVISLGLGVLGLLILFIGCWTYRHNYILLTNLHIIEVKQVGLFGREVSQLSLGHIQDVTGRRNGFWPTILNYGDVLVQSAGESEEFLTQHIPNPQHVAELFQAAHDAFIKQYGN